MATATLKGLDQMRAKLKRLQSRFGDELPTALYQEVEIEATEVKRRTPVDTGTLRGTIHQQGPTRSGQRISTAIVAGGPAAPYAWRVHEDLDAFHKVGQAKYLESVLNESVPHLGRRIAKRIDLNRLVSG